MATNEKTITEQDNEPTEKTVETETTQTTTNRRFSPAVLWGAGVAGLIVIILISAVAAFFLSRVFDGHAGGLHMRGGDYGNHMDRDGDGPMTR